MRRGRQGTGHRYAASSVRRPCLVAEGPQKLESARVHDRVALVRWHQQLWLDVLRKVLEDIHDRVQLVGTALGS